MSISLPTDDELSADTREALRAAPPLNVFRMMARAPASLAPFIKLAQSVLVGAELPAKTREIAVLRVTHVARSQYAYVQHVTLGKVVGVTAAEIDAIAVAGPVTGLDDAGNLVCRAADEITRDVRLSDDTLAAIVARFGQRQATELVLCCSYFNMVSRFLESTRVPLDIVGGRS